MASITRLSGEPGTIPVTFASMTISFCWFLNSASALALLRPSISVMVREHSIVSPKYTGFEKSFRRLTSRFVRRSPSPCWQPEGRDKCGQENLLRLQSDHQNARDYNLG